MIRKFACISVLALALGACGTTDTQRAATGALMGAAVAGPVGAIAGATTGAVMDQGLLEAGRCGAFAGLDADRDARITQAEWRTFRDGAYGVWDINRDGRIARNEFGNCWLSSDTWAVADNDGYWDDGFGFFDDNADGFLDRNEFFADDEFGYFDDDRDLGIEAFEWG